MLRYSLTITLGALLIFALQPLMGKVLLPWFGGGPSIWSACMLFFQVLLLAGYAYSHLLDSALTARSQARLHLAGLGLACLVGLASAWFWPSPITPGPAFRPSDSAWPALRILLALGASVALPFFLLSATSPLIQAWYRRARPGRSPYRLYALSNVGSLTGLLAYPFLVEPALGLGQQAWSWSAGFAVFCLGMLVCAWPLLPKAPSAKHAGLTPAPSAQGPARDQAPSRPLRLLWLALSATGSALLLAATNQICQNVAVVPFLWVLPLALYLLSFILCFHDARLADRRLWAPLYALGSLLVVAMLYHGGKPVWRLGTFEFALGLPPQVAIYGLHMLAGCMLVHGDLVRNKPPASRLTSFYMWMSIGGALGGLFVSLLAPAVFDGMWEFHISLLAVATLSLGVWLRSRRPRRVLCIAGLLSVALLGLAVCLHPGHANQGVLFAERNFYGVVRVVPKFEDRPEYFSYMLYDGQIMHGYQLQAPELKSKPTAYFSHASGLGLMLDHHPARPGPLKVGIIGLGIGTAAALAQPGDAFRFYEINPAVIRLAEGLGGYFSFLKDSPARIAVVEGDARVQLEMELEAGRPGRFDVLVLDAFQSDAIPAHLLTVEALRLYLAHLQKDGVLVMHISNLYLDLEPVVERLAEELGLSAGIIRNAGDGWVSLPAQWMLLSREPRIFESKDIQSQIAEPRSLGEAAPLWTDDTSSLLPILR